VAGLKNYEIKVTNTGHFFSYCKFVTYAPGFIIVGFVKNITDGARRKCSWGAK
jgi:hypothetical protein